MRGLRSSQRGIAVLTAMLVVVIATIIAVEIAWHTALDLRRTENLLSWEQARQFGLGAETVGAQFLQETLDEQTGDDAAFTRTDDKLCGQQALTFTLDQGSVTGTICDVQGRFNLNNLRPVAEQEPSEAIVAQFRRLVTAVVEEYELSDIEVDTVVASTIDWLDSDGTPQFNGAEEDHYTGLQPPYRPANYYFISTSEWRAVRGVTPELYQAMMDCRCITALAPASSRNPTPLNILTAPCLVYRSLGDEIADANAEEWCSFDGSDAQEVEGFRQQIVTYAPELAGIQGYFDTRTSHFELRALITIGSTELAMYSLLQGTGQAVIPIRRSFGVAELAPVSDEAADDTETEIPEDIDG